MQRASAFVFSYIKYVRNFMFMHLTYNVLRVTMVTLLVKEKMIGLRTMCLKKQDQL